MSAIIELKEQILPPDCYVFKHSTKCPISAAAADEVRQGEFSLPLYWVNVIEQRPLSNWIAQHYEIEHQSPQLLKIIGDKVEKVLNHRAIRRGSW